MNDMDEKTAEIFDDLKKSNYPEYQGFTDDQLLQVAKELKEDGEMILEVIDDRQSIDVSTQFEVFILLNGRPDLLGIIAFLYFFNQIHYFNFKKQTELAEALGMTEPTLKAKRDELQKIGLLDIQKSGRKTIWKLNGVQRIVDFNMPKVISERKAYLHKFRKSVITFNDDYLKRRQKEQADQQATLRIDAIVKEKVEKEKEKAKAKQKREEIRFPAEDYSLVLTAYSKYKGVGLVGTEVIRAKRAIKQMFLATRSVKNIVDCMKFFHDNQNNEDMKWLQFWTIETVMKKMPEFVAGKLKARTMDDDYPDA